MPSFMGSRDCAAERRVIIKVELFSHICELFQSVSLLTGQRRPTSLQVEREKEN